MLLKWKIYARYELVSWKAGGQDTFDRRFPYGKIYTSDLQSVKFSPCWVEIHLLNQLAWFDSVLREMGHPSVLATSNS